MAARARATGGTTADGAQLRATRPKAATSANSAAPSPALMLQQALYSELAEEEVKKWPPIATLAFVVATCGAFWAAVGFGVANALG